MKTKALIVIVALLTLCIQVVKGRSSSRVARICTVTVTTESGVLATVYADGRRSIPIANPFTTESNSSFRFSIRGPGLYHVNVSNCQ